MTKILLVRHGQTEWNRVERFRGQADVPLNDTGLAQAEATGKRVGSTWRIDAIYSSPLSRAVKTAEAIARHTQLEVQVLPGFTDIDYGEWQGLSPEEVRQRWPEALDDWYHRPEIAQIPKGESLDDLRRRAMAVLRALIRQHPTDTLALVGHTVINRVTLMAVLGLGNDRFWHIKQDTCAINVIESKEDDFVIVSLNDTCHLNQS